VSTQGVGPSIISISQSDSPSTVTTETPVSNLNLDNARSLSGISSAPKEKLQPANLTLAMPLGCPETFSPISILSTEITEHSAQNTELARNAINLIRAFASSHPRASDTTSDKDASITTLAFLLDSDEADAQRWWPFFQKTLALAKARKKPLSVSGSAL